MPRIQIILLLLIFSLGPAWPNEPQETHSQQKPQQVQATPIGVATKQVSDTATEESRIKARVDASLVKYTLWLFCATATLALIAAIQAWFFWSQLGLMVKGAIDTKNSADAAKTSAEALMSSERAYVKMVHEAPGLSPTLIPDGVTTPFGLDCTVTIKVVNYGKTPATVTDVVLYVQLLKQIEDNFSTDPDYTEAEKHKDKKHRGFLMPTDWFTTPFHFILPHTLETVRAQHGKLIVFGYVEYIDVFDKKHRGGYARVFDSDADSVTQKNNLVMGAPQNYNYDKVI